MTKILSIFIGARQGLPRIPIFAQVGNLAYICDIWATNLKIILVEFLRENI